MPRPKRNDPPDSSEQFIIELLACGCSFQQIERSFFDRKNIIMTHDTLRGIIRRLRERLGAKNAAQLVHIAHQRGYLTNDERRNCSCGS